MEICFYAFTFINYMIICVIDIDMLIIKNIDNIFNWKTPYIIFYHHDLINCHQIKPDPKYYNNEQVFNSGLILVQKQWIQ